MKTTEAAKGTARSDARPKAELLRPPRLLASCVYGAFVRDTRHCDRPLSVRLNHFAASPVCAITWCFDGSFSLLGQDGSGQDIQTPFDAVVFSGPQTGPRTSVNHGPVCAMTLAIYPDAFRKLTGVDVTSYVDRTVSVGEVLSGEFLDAVTSILAVGDAGTGFEAMIGFLQARWQKYRAANPVVFNSISDWASSVITHAPKVGMGRSIRQVERRIKDWTGQSRRDLEFFKRNEKSFILAGKALQEGELNSADVALQSGFSDQSHLGRNIKRQTGHSPKDLLWHIENDEAYWSYRLIAGMAV